METYNLTEKINLLEQKINSLIEILKLAKERNLQLANENQELLARLEAVETKLLKGSEENYQDRELAKMAIDELIAGINNAFNPEDCKIDQIEEV